MERKKNPEGKEGLCQREEEEKRLLGQFAELLAQERLITPGEKAKLEEYLRKEYEL